MILCVYINLLLANNSLIMLLFSSGLAVNNITSEMVAIYLHQCNIVLTVSKFWWECYLDGAWY